VETGHQKQTAVHRASESRTPQITERIATTAAHSSVRIAKLAQRAEPFLQFRESGRFDCLTFDPNGLVPLVKPMVG
jgi:hypothetical protein